MFSHLKAKFRRNPTWYYAMSIAATWAGAGSFIVGTSCAKTEGLLPWILWALGNTLCCIIFGLLADTFPKLRQLAKSKPIQLLMGFMCIFQIWVNMNGIYEMLSPTVIGDMAARIIVYAVSAFFVLFYLRKATFRNVATDNVSWILVYGLIAVLVGYSLLTNGVSGIPVKIVPEAVKNRAWICFTLAFGGFFYPTFWELLDYNDRNEDGTEKTDMKKAFVLGGLLFGFYLIFVLVGSMTTYSPAVDLLKGILVSLVAVSSLSSFLYGAMVNFGKIGGVVIDVASIGLWQLLVPMGVMGVWTLMQNVRIWMVLAMFLIALTWHLMEKRCRA